jgi:hypothetical protein
MHTAPGTRIRADQSAEIRVRFDLADFMFQLTEQEAAALRSQFVILEKGRGRHSKYAPLAFTEHGVAMLWSVLKSERAAQMNILIIRAFVKPREMPATHKDLARKKVSERTTTVTVDYRDDREESCGVLIMPTCCSGQCVSVSAACLICRRGHAIVSH